MPSGYARARRHTGDPFFDIRDHAALALPETLRRARRVALSVPAVIEPS